MHRRRRTEDQEEDRLMNGESRLISGGMESQEGQEDTCRLITENREGTCRRLVIRVNTKGEIHVMKKALTAGIVLAGVIAVSGSAFAAPKKPLPQQETPLKVQEQNQKPPIPAEGFKGKQPPVMSRDKRPPVPPDGKLPPKEAHSGDKRPPMPPRSDDRRPPKR